MARDPLGLEDEPAAREVLDALGDPDCRTIVQRLEEPMTAQEISEACEIPLSTTYRKLELLTEADLLVEQTEIRADGHHTTRYAPGFEAVEFTLDEDRQLEVELARPSRSADEQLARLWSEVRRET